MNALNQIDRDAIAFRFSRRCETMLDERLIKGCPFVTSFGFDPNYMKRLLKQIWLEGMYEAFKVIDEFCKEKANECKSV